MWPGRLILFALLVVDWASGPCQGACLFSAVWASTEAYSVSHDYREEIRRELTSGAAPAGLSDLAAVPASADRPPLALVQVARAGLGDDLLYLDMTLLC